MKELKNKTAVITGAASGIGLSIAKKCAGYGMNLVMVDIEAGALSAALEIVKEKCETVSVVADVSEEDDMKEIYDTAVSRFGDIHLLFNNAGVGHPGFVWQGSKEDWDWVMGVNLYGITNALRYFVPKMISQDCECRIVNTCSSAGLENGPGNGIYRVSKHAVISLSETLYHELKILKSKVGVSVLLPGYIKTRISDASRNRRNSSSPYSGESESNGFESILGNITKTIDFMIREGVEKGKNPDEFAGHVMESIMNDKFYIFSDDSWRHPFEKRVEEISSGINPLPFNR